MAPPDPEARAVGAVVPFDVARAYRDWLVQGSRAGAGGAGDYLFVEGRCRLQPEAADVLARLDDLDVVPVEGGVRLVSERLGAALDVRDVTAASARSFVAALDGDRSLAAVRAWCGAPPAEVDALLAVGFGSVLFAPSAVAELDAGVSAVEIVRHPGSPYEIDRAYWRNMGDVRRALEDVAATFADPAAAAAAPARALQVLRAAHALALVGRDRRTFYRPASPIAARGAEPGELLLTAPELEPSAAGTRFVSGPRVHAAMVGGEVYHRTLYAVVGDPEAALPREHLDVGLPWGRVVLARADTDADTQPWFCPPRPFGEAHLRALFGPLATAHQAAAAGDRDGAVEALATFHQRFVRLHPFRCANQCLAMSLVNAVLRRSHGAGMPHLVLDHLALRVTPAAYRRLFARAVAGWVVPGDGALARWRELAARKHRAFECVARVASAPSPGAALAVLAEDLEAARLALFTA